MIRKVYGIFVRTAIAVLLVLSLWLVIGAASTKDIGNLSDWISSTSTFGTLIVAYMAFKAAPKWIHQKMDEQALNQAVILISRDIPELQRLMDLVTEDVSHFVIMKDLANNDGEIDFFFNEFRTDFPRLNSTLNEIKNLTFNIQRDFSALNKIGWNLVPAAADKFRFMNNSTHYLLKRYTSMQRLIEQYNGFFINGESDRSTRVKQSIMDIGDSIDSLYDKFNKDLEGFYQYANNVPLYFEGK